jgi:sulfur relay (sulfurtransferase) DsrF/TusC family protein
VLASVTAAFLVADGSFYLLSGYFPEQSWSGYASHFAKYYPYYLIGTSVYVAIAALLHTAVHFGAREQARAR